MDSPFRALGMAPADPILGLNETFNRDPRPHKINLGIGVYTDANGQIPLLSCVVAAEAQIQKTSTARGYLPIDGLDSYDLAARKLVFGDNCEAVNEGRVVTIQGLGGTGSLRIGADFLRMLTPDAKVLVADPTWENHTALFESAGFRVETYPYYDAKRRALRSDDLLSRLHDAEHRSIVVLHACCHNPTGYDPSSSEWDAIVNICVERELTPFIDMAYQGFGSGIEEDRQAVTKFTAAGLNLLVANSFSKNFSLYGERVGSLSIVTSSPSEAQRVRSQIKTRIRTNYSNPPTHGAHIVSVVLNSPDLRAEWEVELDAMRHRIQQMRETLVKHLASHGRDSAFNHLLQQKGMFSYSSLTTEQMHLLRNEHGIYGLDSGRICIAALNPGNIDRVAKAIAAVTA